MLPSRKTIRRALIAANETLYHVQSGHRGYDDNEAVVYERIRALNHVLRTGEPYLPIVKQYDNQADFRERWGE